MLLALESLYEPTSTVTVLVDPYQAYLSAGTGFGSLANPGSGNQTVYATFDEDRRQLLPFVDTDLIYPGPNNQPGDPSALRYFYGVRFLGSGTLYVRAYADQTLVQTGYVVAAEDPNQASVFNLPQGTGGYGLRLQWTGLGWMRMYIIDWDYYVEPGEL